MRLTVLGKSPAWQDAGGACSGYLLEEDDTTVLIDCGNGVFSKLREQIDYVDVDAVVISHLHADHFLDLIPYAYALSYAPRQQPVPVPPWPGTDDPARPRLIAPPGAEEFFRNVTGNWGQPELIETAFRLEEYEETVHSRSGAAHLLLPGGSPLHRDLRHERVLQRGQRASLLQRGLEPVGGARGLCQGRRSAAHRSHPAQARAQRDARSPDAPGGGRARPRGRRGPGGAHPHLRRARLDVGAQAGRGGVRRAGGAGAGGVPLPALNARGWPRLSSPGYADRVNSERDLFANFERMRREIDELFGDVFERTGIRGRGFSPPVDVYYTDDPPRAVVKADLAGVLIDDVALEIRGRQLLIAGERRAEQAEGRLFQQIEIEHGPFRRSVELGSDVVAEEARAAYEDGILVVEVPLARRDQTHRRVPIEEGRE
ncbi:MAG: Hsp20 family protein [Thermoleophilaceae bacterium]